MTISKSINATEAARNFSDMLNQDKYQGTTFDIVRGRDVVAKIVSSGPVTALKVAELCRLFATLPHLDEDDAAAFEQDIDESLASLTHKGQVWD